jgi:hypothetical protein
MNCINTIAPYVDLIESIAVIIATVVAIIGVNSWRDEAKWKRKYDLAEDVLTLFYTAQHKIRIIRSVMIYAGEGSSRTKELEETDEEKKIKDKAYIIVERYQKHRDAFDKLEAIKFRFFAVFGKENGVPFESLTKLINRLDFAAQEMQAIELGEWGIEDRIQKRKESLKRQNIVFNTKREEDEIEMEMDKIIKLIESICEQIVNKTK